jgi:hypothetical protein
MSATDTPHDSIFGIAVDRKRELKWLFSQGKATRQCTQEVRVYSENALNRGAGIRPNIENI